MKAVPCRLHDDEEPRRDSLQKEDLHQITSLGHCTAKNNGKLCIYKCVHTPQYASGHAGTFDGSAPSLDLLL